MIALIAKPEIKTAAFAFISSNLIALLMLGHATSTELTKSLHRKRTSDIVCGRSIDVHVVIVIDSTYS